MEQRTPAAKAASANDSGGTTEVVPFPVLAVPAVSIPILPISVVSVSRSCPSCSAQNPTNTGSGSS